MRSFIVGYSKLPGNRRGAAVDLIFVFKGKTSGIPALTEIYLKAVFAILQHISHIIALIVKMVGIVCKSGSKKTVANLLSVDFRLIDTEGGYLQRGF